MLWKVKPTENKNFDTNMTVLGRYTLAHKCTNWYVYFLFMMYLCYELHKKDLRRIQLSSQLHHSTKIKEFGKHGYTHKSKMTSSGIHVHIVISILSYLHVFPWNFSTYYIDRYTTIFIFVYIYNLIVYLKSQ